MGRLDPEVAKFIEGIGEDCLSPTRMSLEESRRDLENAVPPLKIKLHKIEDISILGPGGDLALRVYTPSETKNTPVIVYYHGGGWTRGSLKTAEGMCATIARDTGFAVVSPDYRLAPEHPYPAAVDDSYRALTWVNENAEQFGWDPAHLAVAGDSAGGTMAAVMALKARNEDGPKVAYQVMLCPALNLFELDTASYRDFGGGGYLLTKEWVEYYRGLYAPDSKTWPHPYVSPLLEKDFSGLPPALLVAAEFDVLRDETAAYAEKLEKAGVPAKLSIYPGMVHDFMLLLPEIESSKKVFDEVSSCLKGALVYE